MHTITKRKHVIDRLKATHRYEDLACLTDQQIDEFDLILTEQLNIYQHLESSVTNIKFKPKALIGSDYKLSLTLKNQECPTCEQNVRLSKEKIHGPMAKMLYMMRQMDRENPGSYINVTQICVDKKLKYQNITISKAAYWGLIECAQNTDKTKNHSGRWRLTAAGIAFVDGLLGVDKYKYVYNRQLYPIPLDEKKKNKYVTIKDCFGEHFNFTEFINNYN